MDNYVVSFDKEIYYPGDTVTARIEIRAPYPRRTRAIIVSIESEELTRVEYTETHHDSDGDIHTTTYTERESFMHTYEEVVLEPRVDYHQFELTARLPSYPLVPIDTSAITVSHHVHIKVDIKLGVDKHIYIPIPYTIARPQLSPLSTQTESAIINMSSTNLFTGQDLSISIEPLRLFNHRKIRVELRAKIWVRAGMYSDDIYTTIATWKFDKDERQLNIPIPSSPYYTMQGENFSIDVLLVIVFDIAFKSDVNIEIPVIYTP